MGTIVRERAAVDATVAAHRASARAGDGSGPGAAATAALDAYEPFAPFYDEFTADYAHDAWLERIEAMARAHGLSGRRVLDVACGTGKSAAPLLARGYEVTACDISPAMVARARRRLGGDPGRVFVADMRSLPPSGRFDLVTCLDDAVNYLLTDADLEAALRSFASALRPGGLAVFDANSLSAYRTLLASSDITASDDTVFLRRRDTRTEVEPGSTFQDTIEILHRGPDGRLRAAVSRHLQRHHPRARIEAACARAGLPCVAVRGHLPGGRVLPEPDEDRHLKLVYVSRKPQASDRDQGG